MASAAMLMEWLRNLLLLVDILSDCSTIVLNDSIAAVVNGNELKVPSTQFETHNALKWAILEDRIKCQTTTLLHMAGDDNLADMETSS